MAIETDESSITLYRNGGTRKRQIYMDKDSVRRLSFFADKLWPATSTMTVTWDTEPSGDTSVSLTSKTISGLGAECYATPQDDTYNIRTKVKATAVNSGGETESCMFSLYITQT